MRPDTAEHAPDGVPEDVDVAPTSYFAVWQAKEDYLDRGIAAVQRCDRPTGVGARVRRR